MAHDFEPSPKLHCRVPHPRPSPSVTALALHYGTPGSRRRAAYSMLARRGGLASAKRQRLLGWPNLTIAWEKRRRKREREEADRALEARQRIVEVWSRGIVG